MQAGRCFSSASPTPAVRFPAGNVHSGGLRRSISVWNFSHVQVWGKNASHLSVGSHKLRSFWFPCSYLLEDRSRPAWSKSHFFVLLTGGISGVA